MVQRQRGAKESERLATTNAETRRAGGTRSRQLGRVLAHVGHLVLSVSVLSSFGVGGVACNKSESASAPTAQAEASKQPSPDEGQRTARQKADAPPPSPTTWSVPEAPKDNGGDDAKMADRQPSPARTSRIESDETINPFAFAPPAATMAPKEKKGKSGAGDGRDRGNGPGLLGNVGSPPSTPVAGGGGVGVRDKSPAKPSTPPKLETATGSGTMGPGRFGTGLAQPPAEAPIDPNGRFATTYRPGAGHLAAFDSAVARGIVPADEKEVVSDLGARYSPDFQLPKGKTLFAQNELERAKQPPAGGAVHLRIALKSADIAPAARPHLSVHLVLDVSGSMAGASIENARTAAAALVDKLAPGDDFSLVTFSSEAQVLVPDGPVGARRAAIKKTIEGIHEGGGTNIGEGLTLGYHEASKPTIPTDAVKVVLLLSDGRANSGILDQGRLSTLALNAFQDGVQTSTFGLGGDYDGALMSSIANDGAGGYYYLRDAQQIAPALATEMDKRLDPVATALEVRVRLRPGVQLLQAYGSRRLNASEEIRVRVQEIAADVQAEKKGIKRDRQDDQKGGMRFFLPGFARNDAHAILLKLSLPEGVGDKEVALVELKYKDRVKKTNVQEELVVKTSYAGSDAESAGTINGSVARSVQGFAAGETLAEASRLIANGSRESAVAVLSEREGILRQMAETMGEPLFLKDADRLARLRSHAGSTTGLGDPLVLAMLLETASNAHRH
jgi:Ca-activated chloride channel homolog